jgi:transposase
VYVLCNGLKWRDAPREYGPYKTLYNRFIRWSEVGAFGKILQKLSKCETEILMMDATHLKVHRTAASLKKGVFPAAHWANKGGLGKQAACRLWWLWAG